MTTGPQLLLDAAATVKTKREKADRTCYYNWACDDSVIKSDWFGICFADLSCIGQKVIGTPAFMSLRIGYARECDEAFVKFLCDPEASPWRSFADELFPPEPMLLSYKGATVNVNSHAFRNDVGIMLLKPISRRIAINFLKAYRLLGEYPEFVKHWYEFVQDGFAPVDAFWAAQFCGESGNGYDFPHYFDHNIWDYGDRDVGQELINMRASNLPRYAFKEDPSILVTRGSRFDSDFYGCDAIFRIAETPIKLDYYDARKYFRTVKKQFIETTVVSGGLHSREENAYGACSKQRVRDFLRQYIKDHFDNIKENIDDKL